MKPILLIGHQRSVTHIQYNQHGDLLFSTSKDYLPTVWNSRTGERLGTYDGHGGSVWYCCVNRESTEIITAGADNSTRLWDVETGREKGYLHHQAPARACDWSCGEKTFLTVTDSVLGQKSAICVYSTEQSLGATKDTQPRPVLEILGSPADMKITQAKWGPLNKTILAGNDMGQITVYDARTGRPVKEIRDHSKTINEIQFDYWGLLFLTCSRDGSAKLYDVRTLEHLKTYETGRPVYSAAVSPTEDWVITGGGQSVEAVTTTRVDQNQFKAKFFHLIHQEEIGRIQGHFGPIQSMCFSPDGRSFTTGAEDGYIRVHHMDTQFKKELQKASEI